MRKAALNTHGKACDRLSRLKDAGASPATLREETYRVTRGDQRRSTVRQNGTVALRSDTDYQGRKLVSCLAPMPVAPSVLRVSGKVDVASIDDARHDQKLSKAVNAADTAAHALHMARIALERDLADTIRLHNECTGERRKALRYKIRAIIEQHSHDVALMRVAKLCGWRVE